MSDFIRTFALSKEIKIMTKGKSEILKYILHHV